MNNNKGFTLVELIGIIIILGLTIIIGVPSLLNTLKSNENTEYETFKETLFLAAETYILDNKDSIHNFQNVNDSVSIPLSLLNKEGLIKSNLIDPSTKSSILMNQLIKVTISADGDYKYAFRYKYNDREIVYFNPATRARCDKQSYQESPISTNGCLKWYVFGDSINDSSIKMILDHNVTGTYNSTFVDAKSVSSQLITNYKWKINSRFITAEEIAAITDNKAFNVNKSSPFYLGTNTDKLDSPSDNKKISWLFDFTDACISYGCAQKFSGTSGYWTDSARGSSIHWVVNYEGKLIFDANTSQYGVRPVIEISKEKI